MYTFSTLFIRDRYGQCSGCLVRSGTLVKHFASLRYILFYFILFTKRTQFTSLPFHCPPFVYAALPISGDHHFGHYLVTCAK